LERFSDLVGCGRPNFFRNGLELQGSGKVQTAYVVDRFANVRLQYDGDLPAERRIVKNERTDIVFFVILYDQITFVGAGAIPMNIPEHAEFAPQGLIVFFFGLRPYRRPIGDTMPPHEWMISEFHTAP
jgi:hypothetical protein